MAEPFNGRHVTAEACIRSQANACGIYDGPVFIRVLQSSLLSVVSQRFHTHLIQSIFRAMD
jgi:hypothetical protein